MLNGEAIDEVEHFTDLGSKMSTSTDREEARDPCSDFKAKSGFCISSEHLEIQKHQTGNQYPTLQEQCLKYSIVCCRIVEDEQDHLSQTRTVPEQVSAKGFSAYFGRTPSQATSCAELQTQSQYHTAGTAKEIEMDQPCASHDTYSPAECRPQMDP